MKAVTMAVLQTSSQADIAQNLIAIEYSLQQVAKAGAQCVILPEGFAQLGANPQQKRISALQERYADGPVQTWLARMSQHYQLWIVAGGLTVQPEGQDKSVMRCLVYNHQGHCVGHYDKIHLFDASFKGKTEQYSESQDTSAGSQPVVIPTPWGRMGLSICYDLRFPELYRQLADQQMDWVCVPAAFTQTTGRAHWEILLRARAIENQCFVVAAAQTGQHSDGRQTWGHSVIIDPWGQILCDAGVETGWVMTTLKPEILQETRNAMECLTHRRLH